MKNFLTILFAYRNRDLSRIELSLDSLKNQSRSNFKVLFIDYGSKDEFAVPLRNLVDKYAFAEYKYIAHQGLLWNKSKAFNFGIKESTTPFILTADVDLLFHPETIKILESIASHDSFTLFNYGYLPKEVKPGMITNSSFENLEPKHYGDINGVGLFSKTALEKIRGFDEFFHFYGSEDVDLFERLENAGISCKREKRNLFLHQWHPRYPQKWENKLTVVPRLSNVLRLNQQHYFRSKRENLIVPPFQISWGNCYFQEDLDQLKRPTEVKDLNNLSATVIHFLNESLLSYKGEIVRVNFREDKNFLSLKDRIKKMVGRNYQPYLSMKEINDLILEKIIFYYRDFNYSYEISGDLKTISFTIDLRVKNLFVAQI